LGWKKSLRMIPQRCRLLAISVCGKLLALLWFSLMYSSSSNSWTFPKSEIYRYYRSASFWIFHSSETDRNVQPPTTQPIFPASSESLSCLPTFATGRSFFPMQCASGWKSGAPACWKSTFYGLLIALLSMLFGIQVCARELSGPVLITLGSASCSRPCFAGLVRGTWKRVFQCFLRSSLFLFDLNLKVNSAIDSRCFR